MAEQNNNQGLEQFRDTSIAFDSLIVQVGRAIARAQEEMDLSQADFQREVARLFKEGKITRLDVLPQNAFTMPETSLSLKIGLSMNYNEDGTPALSATPLNANTVNQSDVDVEAATEVKLKFNAIPQSEEPPGIAPSALSAEQATELSQAHGVVQALQNDQGELNISTVFIQDARLWLINYLNAREPILTVVIDDRRAKVLYTVDSLTPPTEAELAPIGPPVFQRVEPTSGKRGDILTIYGDNFLTLAGQTILKIDDRPVPMVRHTINSIAFKIPGWAIRGDVEVITPIGATDAVGKSGFTPLPEFLDFEPKQGYYNALSGQGSWISIYGNNLRQGCKIRFATGAESVNTEIVSPGQLKVQIPADAGSGPLTLLFEGHEESLAQAFLMLPRVDRVSPRQARVGDEITLSGNYLGDVTEVYVGDSEVKRQDFSLHTPDQIRVLVPPGATDGRLRVRETLGQGYFSEVETRDIFYVVPRITGFGERILTVGSLLNVQGEGLDPDPDMMTMLFDGREGLSEGQVLSVAPDRSNFTVRLPEDAAAGYVLLLRKRVYSEYSMSDTTDTSANKLTVLRLGGAPSDVIREERFDADLTDWQSEAGAWRIDEGMLASTGSSRLSFGLPELRKELTVYSDVLKADRFGYSLTPAGGGPRMQIWVDLTSDSPALTWSTFDGSRVDYIQGRQLSLPAGENHLIQINSVYEQLEGKDTLKLILLLDQAEVQSYNWEVNDIEKFALLSDSDDQRWDNVVILKGDYLSLPGPGFYRFGDIPEPPVIPPLNIATFTPASGGPGTEVTLTGLGLDDAARFYFGGAEAGVVEALGESAKITVPEGAKTGPLVVHGRGGAVTTTKENLFQIPPEILNLIPSQVLVGQELNILGTNLPTTLEGLEIKVLEQTAQVIAATPSMLTVIVPETLGSGAVSLSYQDFSAQSPLTLEVRRETLVQDLVATSENAVWTTSAGEVNFGLPSDGTTAAAQLRGSERMEDDVLYGPLLYLHPPGPSLRALRGLFPVTEVPDGRLELRLELGMLWSSTPAPEETSDVDGVLFEVQFLDADDGSETSLLPRTVVVHDGSLERFVIDATPVAGRKGRLVLQVFAGRSGLKDDAALVSGQLIKLT